MRHLAAALLALAPQHRYLCYPARTLCDTPVVLVGGTRDWRDVVDDLDVRWCALATEGGGKVHCGIRDRTRRLLKQGVIREFCQRQVEPVTFAGWSLGGGVSVLLASTLLTEGVAVASVHTYGAPRVGDADFAQWYAAARLNERTWRYETPRDPIVRLPPTPPYVAVGHRVEVPCTRERSLAHHDLHAYVQGL